MKLAASLVFAFAGLAGAQHPPSPELVSENVLVVVADDLGVDMLSAYGLGSDLPSTPTIDALAAGGVVFTNAWSNPVCSSTRATLLTGRYAFRTGVGYLVGPSSALALSPTELLLPELLDQTSAGYRHAAFGKWHLGNDSVGGSSAPLLAGFATFLGTDGNLGIQPQDYFSWTKNVNGESVPASGYVTSDTVDDALDFALNAPEPWFCYLSFHAPHLPFHAPPAGLHQTDLSTAGPPSTDPRPYYKAMIEALDAELGRLLAGLASKLDDTTIVFVGDNGTPQEVTVPPFDPNHAKGTIFEGGIRVPLIVASDSVVQPGRTSSALVNTVDVFATVAELAAAPLPSQAPSSAPSSAPGPFGVLERGPQAPLFPTSGEVVDGVSLMPYLLTPNLPSIRTTAFAELFLPNGFGMPTVLRRAIRNDRYKLVHSIGAFAPDAAALEPTRSLYDLAADPFETTDLLSR